MASTKTRNVQGMTEESLLPPGDHILLKCLSPIQLEGWFLVSWSNEGTLVFCYHFHFGFVW